MLANLFVINTQVEIYHCFYPNITKKRIELPEKSNLGNPCTFVFLANGYWVQRRSSSTGIVNRYVSFRVTIACHKEMTH